MVMKNFSHVQKAYFIQARGGGGGGEKGGGEKGGREVGGKIFFF